MILLGQLPVRGFEFPMGYDLALYYRKILLGELSVSGTDFLIGYDFA